jgi:glycoprotein endo-alpha-1,2-mannosidase
MTTNLGIFYYTMHQLGPGAFNWVACTEADQGNRDTCGSGNITPCNACQHSLPTRWSGRYLPDLGLYNTADANIMRQHFQWMQNAGIGFVIFSWWGQNSISDTALTTLLNVIPSFNLKFTIYYENEAYGNPNISADIDYLNNKCFNHASYQKVNSKPTIWVYNENKATDIQRWITVRNSKNLYVVLKEAPGWQTTTVIDGWHQYAPASRYGITKTTNKKYSSFVSPGFYRYHACSRLQRCDLNNSWQDFETALSTMKNDGATWHTIQTWNEWMECSGVEPAAYYNHTLSGPFPKVNNSYGTKYLDLIRKYFGQPMPEKKFSVYSVVPNSTISNTGVLTVLDPAGTLTKDQACVESCRRLGLV